MNKARLTAVAVWAVDGSLNEGDQLQSDLTPPRIRARDEV